MRPLPHTEPPRGNVDASGGRKADGPDKPDKPLFALHLNRYRDRASYPGGAAAAKPKLGTPHDG